MHHLKQLTVLLLLLLLSACATQPRQSCLPADAGIDNCPPAEAIDDPQVNAAYESRTWRSASELTIDPVTAAREASIPVDKALTKVIGPGYDEALTSLAAKIWLIDNAKYTIDAMYYIFQPDIVGYSMLGALCNAVKRGVDVRLMVDSLGSISSSHHELRALETCAEDAGFMRNTNGVMSTKRARVQVVIFNAISKLHFNRRSHDKILVVDGHFSEDAAVMTGGRNISKDYYGINEDGSKDPTAFRDLEIFMRADPHNTRGGKTVGDVSELYYSLLFLYPDNKRLRPLQADQYRERYKEERELSQQRLAFLKGMPEFQRIFASMPQYTRQGFHNAEVRLAHQLGNLTETNVTTSVLENIEKNPNSILYLMDKIANQSIEQGNSDGTLRIVSPYLFSGMYYNEAGEVVFDGAKDMLELLAKNPQLRIEIVTNSVMSSDNFITQAIIDFDMAPRLLLTPELQDIWADNIEEGEMNPEIVESDQWKQLINNPQIFIYETGKLDSVLLPGGSTHYGKLHAKFIVGENIGFIGTSNFDYRSNLYNNELGFFYRSDAVHEDLVAIFERLKSTSYRWGTPKWLEMRKQLRQGNSEKSGPARKQRFWFNATRALGIEYLM